MSIDSTRDPSSSGAPVPTPAPDHLSAPGPKKELSLGQALARGVEVLFALTAPPVVGLLMLGALWAGEAPHAIERSGAATAAALVVAATLILAPAFLYWKSADSYRGFKRELKDDVREALAEAGVTHSSG